MYRHLIQIQHSSLVCRDNNSCEILIKIMKGYTSEQNLLKEHLIQYQKELF